MLGRAVRALDGLRDWFDAAPAQSDALEALRIMLCQAGRPEDAPAALRRPARARRPAPLAAVLADPHATAPNETAPSLGWARADHGGWTQAASRARTLRGALRGAVAGRGCVLVLIHHGPADALAAVFMDAGLPVPTVSGAGAGGAPGRLTCIAGAPAGGPRGLARRLRQGEILGVAPDWQEAAPRQEFCSPRRCDLRVLAGAAPGVSKRRAELPAARCGAADGSRRP
jgi:hypothetical protein